MSWCLPKMLGIEVNGKNGWLIIWTLSDFKVYVFELSSINTDGKEPVEAANVHRLPCPIPIKPRAAQREDYCSRRLRQGPPVVGDDLCPRAIAQTLVRSVRRAMHGM